MSIAPQITRWRQLNRGIGGFTQSGFTRPDYPIVELFIDGGWVSITRLDNGEAGVYYRDSITISGRGLSDEDSQASAATATLTINNRDGRFSPRNPASPLYGKIGRNTQIRISRYVNGVFRERFTGEVPSWPSRWDVSGRDVYIQIQATGILRRMNQGTAPLRSAYYRAFSAPSRQHIKAYWPCEEQSNSTTIASGLPNVRAMVVNGSPEFGSFSDYKASDALPAMNNASFRGVVPRYDTPSDQVFVFKMIVSFPTALASEQSLFVCKTTGTTGTWEVTMNASWVMRITCTQSDGTVAHTVTSDFSGAEGLFAGVTGMFMLYAGTGKGTGTVAGNMGYVLRFYRLTSTQDVDHNLGHTEISHDLGSPFTNGRVTNVTIGDDGGLTDTVVGHIVVGDNEAAVDNFTADFDAMVAYNGESPSTRIARLCAEEGINLSLVTKGKTGNDVRMGWQTSNTRVALLQECADTDGSILYEPRDQVGLAFRTRLSLYNQTPAVTLDYSAHQLSDSLSPTDDDQLTRNDITVSRNDGGSSRAQLQTGTMSILDPPNGVGRYDTSVSISLSKDGDLDDQAGWRLFLGTIDEERYPQISVNLSHPAISSDLQLVGALLALDVGDRIKVTNTPEWMPPGDVDQIVLGYTETMDQFLHTITFNCRPASPYDVGFLNDDDFGRVDTDGSSVAGQTDSSQTSMSVAVTAGALWTTDPADFPFEISVSGITRNVTSISGSSSPQTFTLDPATVHGTVITHHAGDDVRLATPTIISL